MTFKEWFATGRHVADVHTDTGDGYDPESGWIFAGELYVLDCDSGYLTILFNEQHMSGDLAAVAKPLYEFAASEGYFN